MRRNFLIWLFALICAAFAVTGAVTFYQFRNHAQERAAQMLSTRLDDLMDLIIHASNSVEKVASINNTSTLEKTRAFAELVRLNPHALRVQETLQGFCNDIGATQACITDGDGVVVAAVPSHMIGFDFSTSDETRPFMACINTPGKELCTRPSASDTGSTDLYQYAAVTRRDSPGVIRVGFRSQQEQVMRAASNFGQLAGKYRLGENGHIVAFFGGEPLNKNELPAATMPVLLGLPLNEPGEITVNDVDYYTYAIDSEGFRLVGLMAVSALRQETLSSVHRLVLSNLILFVAMFALVAYLLQRLVIRGIRVINTTLKRITAGELNQRVEVRSCPEFAELSTGINTMTDSLLGYAEKEHLRIRDELELARTIQYTVLPNKFPAYPNHPEFDLFATCTQAKVVGGDFYDFFKTDSNHLAFLVADMSDSGIAAALFMMRCMSVIRSVSRSESDPLVILNETNRILCEGHKTDMHLTLFLGNLNFRTGELCYVNAGRPQAMLQRCGGQYTEFPVLDSPPIGTQQDAVYERYVEMLEPGDRIFLYSEGAVNVMDASNTPFGIARLLDALHEPAAGVNDVLRNVRAALRRFIGSSEPNMDITMLSLAFQGEHHAHSELVTPAGAQEEVASTLAGPLESVFAAPDYISDLQASVITILNTLPEDLPVDIRLRCNAQEAMVTLRYASEQFNPLLSLPHLPVDHAEHRSDGGSGSVLTLRKNLE